MSAVRLIHGNNSKPSWLVDEHYNGWVVENQSDYTRQFTCCIYIKADLFEQLVDWIINELGNLLNIYICFFLCVVRMD